jgi:hypothetical protein
MHLSAFDNILWATGLIGQAVLLLVLFHRKRARFFPIFTTMVGLSFLGSTVLYFVYSHWGGRAYYYGYWTLGTTDMLIQLGVVYEIASHVFAPLGTWAVDVRNSFIRLVGGSVLVALLLTMLASPARSSTMETVIARGTFFSSALMTELFVGLVALSAVAGLPWKTHVARIAQAQGVYSLLCVVLDTSTSWLGWAHQADAIHTLSQVRIVAYLGALVYWIATLWQEAPEPREMPALMRMQIFHLQRQVEYDLGRIRGWRKI